MLEDEVAEAKDSKEELMKVGRKLVDFHGEMILLENYSALNYTGFCSYYYHFLLVHDLCITIKAALAPFFCNTVDSIFAFKCTCLIMLLLAYLHIIRCMLAENFHG